MTEKQYYAARAALEVTKAEVRLIQARKACEHGYKRLQGDVDKAKIDLAKAEETRDEEYEKLKLIVQEAELTVEMDKAYAANTKMIADNNFEV